MYKVLTSLVLIAGFAIVGCQGEPTKPKEAEKPKLSDLFKTQLVQYLKDAGKLSAQSDAGLSFTEFKSQLSEVKATYDLLVQTWPKDFAPIARDAFGSSHEGYDLTIRLWTGKLKKLDYPMEPNINGWTQYNEYAGKALVVKVLEYSNVEEYKGKKHMPFDENIGVLLALAGKHFEDGRSIVLKQME